MNYLKQIRFYKVTNLVLLLITIFIFFRFKYEKVQCDGVDCLYNMVYGVYNPVIVSIPIFIVIITLFLFLPSHYFRRWLWYVASWALPLLFYFVMSESVYNSGLFSGRDFTAKIGMYILAAISMAFVVGVFAFGQITTYIKKRSHIQ